MDDPQEKRKCLCGCEKMLEFMSNRCHFCREFHFPEKCKAEIIIESRDLEISKLKEENERLNRVNRIVRDIDVENPDAVNVLLDLIKEQKIRIDGFCSTIRTLAKALKGYGVHKKYVAFTGLESCGLLKQHTGARHAKCTCGFDEVLSDPTVKAILEEKGL